MLISELIAKLAETMETHGDLPVALKETRTDFDGSHDTVYETCQAGWLSVENIEFEDVEQAPVASWATFSGRWVRIQRVGPHLVIDAT
jgi:hypothetical protein